MQAIITIKAQLNDREARQVVQAIEQAWPFKSKKRVRPGETKNLWRDAPPMFGEDAVGVPYDVEVTWNAS